MQKSLVFLLLLAGLQLRAQYWQQRTDYVLDIRLNDREHTLDGFEKLVYTNHSPDTLRFVWFHLWPNAYKNDRTAFSDQLLQHGSTDFYFSSKEKRGYINRLDFRVNGAPATWEDHPEHIDIIKLLLPTALAPGQSATITTPFHVKLPYTFSRSGFDGRAYQITQWYPKPAVYDAKGWHPMPYLDLGEFYSEFGSFDVRITLPKDYVVAATGVLQDAEEGEWMLKRKGIKREEQKQEQVKVKKQQSTKAKQGTAKSKKTSQEPAVTEVPVEKTLRFVQDSAHDFALFAAKDYRVQHDTCSLSSGTVIDVYSFYFPEQADAWKNSIALAKAALRTRSRWIGPYPYQTASIVQGAESVGGGMEYPAVTVLSPMPSEHLLEELIGHELGHNWFYSALASNERQHPWLDEGLNSYYDYRYQQEKYGDTGSIQLGKATVNTEHLQQLLLQTKAVQKNDQPIDLPADQFAPINYSLIQYHKTARWLQDLEEQLTRPVFDSAMQHYYRLWRFKHPYPDDFQRALEQISGKDLTAWFRLLQQTGMVTEVPATKGWKIASPLNPSSIASYIRQPANNLLTLLPAVGYNTYDKFMVGGVFTNYKLPPSKFGFLLAPLYATGSGRFTGLGRISYTAYSKGAVRRTEFFVNAARFSMNELTNDKGGKITAGFQKLVPGLRLTLKEKSVNSPIRRSLQWKTYLIREGSFRFSLDTTITNGDTSVQQMIGINNGNRYLNQFQFDYQNLRELYPYELQLRVEQASSFVRPTVTAHYFFNYPKGGGLQVRFFAGLFLYTGGKTTAREFAADRYHLNLTGPNGYEDYTYSNYFIGRNEFERLPSQQIMLRDGAFKVRTDLLAEKIGRSDEWLTALNVTTTIPSAINPLSVLPVTIPLRVYANVGTYAEAWKQNEGGRFLFDVGLQIPLLNQNVQVYIPIIHSKLFRDYIRSTITEKRFWRTISFSIQLNKPALRKLSREIDL